MQQWIVTLFAVQQWIVTLFHTGPMVTVNCIERRPERHGERL